MKPSYSSVSGFTLTELVVVLVIVGVVGAIALPSFKALIQGQQVKNASYDLYTGLIMARSEAIKRNALVTITPVTYSVANPTPHDEKGWVIAAAGGIVIENQSQLKGIALTATPDSSPWVTYQRTGRPAAGATPVFKIDAYGEATVYARCVSIELSGRPRIYKAVNGNC